MKPAIHVWIWKADKVLAVAELRIKNIKHISICLQYLTQKTRLFSQKTVTFQAFYYHNDQTVQAFYYNSHAYKSYN